MKKRGKLVLGIIQVFVAVGALPAGYSMMVQPDGAGIGMTLDILSTSPFKDFFIPGLFLFTVNGVFNLVSALFAFIKSRYTWILGMGLGIALIIWVIVQIYSVGLTHFLQPTFFIIGVVEIVLSIYIYKNEKPVLFSD